MLWGQFALYGFGVLGLLFFVVALWRYSASFFFSTSSRLAQKASWLSVAYSFIALIGMTVLALHVPFWVFRNEVLLNATQMPREWYVGSLGFSLYFLLFLFLPMLGLLSTPFFIAETFQRLGGKLRSGIQSKLAMLAFVLYFVGCAGLAIFFFSEFVNVQASRFFKLHAAIKNTCIVDPRQDHCPHSLTELSYIEPQEFAEVSKYTQLFYQYDPDRNLYVFVVRYARDHVVVFSNGFGDPFVDFRELRVREHPTGFGRGTAEVIDAPEVPGPWTVMPLWNK